MPQTEQWVESGEGSVTGRTVGGEWKRESVTERTVGGEWRRETVTERTAGGEWRAVLYSV